MTDLPVEEPLSSLTFFGLLIVLCYSQDVKRLDLNYNDLLTEEGMKRIRQRRSEVEDWIDQLNDEEKVLLRDTRDVKNASEVKEILLELLREDPEVQNELIVSKQRKIQKLGAWRPVKL